MRISIIGDIHGSILNLKRIIPKLKKSEIIFVTGDITGTISYPLVIKSILKSRRISREKYAELVYNDYISEFIDYQISSARKIIKLLLSTKTPIFFTHGNSDVKEARDFFSKISKENENLFYVGNNIEIHEKWLVAGYGFSSPSTYRTPFKTPGEKKNDEISYDLKKLEQKITSLRETNEFILVSLLHEPPLNSELDFMPYSTSHGGSKLISEYIHKIPFDYVFAGHIHESQNYEITDNNIMLNPGPLLNGEWAFINYKTRNVQLKKLFISLTIKGFAYKTREIFK